MLLGRRKYETFLKYNEAGHNWLDSSSEEKHQGAEVDHKKSVCQQHYAITKKWQTMYHEV